MKMYKSIFVMIALVSMVMGQPIPEEEIKPLTNIMAVPITEEDRNNLLQTPLELKQTRANTIAEAGSAAVSSITSTTSHIQEVIQETYNSYKPTVGQLADQLGEAFKVTVQQEASSIKKALQSIKEAGGQIIKAGINSAKTGFDIFFVIPKFAINALVTGNKKPESA